jgi:DNA repair protein RadC
MEKTFKGCTPEIYLKKKKSEFPKVQIRSSGSAYDFIKKLYSDDVGIYESMFALLLNRSNNTVGYVKISQGGVHGTVADPILVAKYAIESLSSRVILVHNHPSGNLSPSDQDKIITQKIKDTLKLFDCHLIDHLIVAEEEGFYSFADNGIL